MIRNTDKDLSTAEKVTQVVKRIIGQAWSETGDKIGGFAASGEVPHRARRFSLAIDGVGSKLQIARLLGRHDTVGIDGVIMPAMDVYADGFIPHAVVDYFSTYKFNEQQIEQVLAGIVAGCQQLGCQLIGGETAFHPELHRPTTYDLACACLGFSTAQLRLDPRHRIRPGMTIWGWLSFGLGSNGYTFTRESLGLAADISDDAKRAILQQKFPDLDDVLGNVLLRPTRQYLNELEAARQDGVKYEGLAHITGDGLAKNLQRILPPGCQAVVYRQSWERPPIFNLVEKLSGCSYQITDRHLNQGIQFISIVSGDKHPQDDNCVQIGEITERREREPAVVMRGTYLDL
ncbi:AIR synthase related protein [Patescibacteria group bacterium]